MKSISTKLSVAMIACTLLAAALVSVINISKAREMNERDSEALVRLECEAAANELDKQLVAIERSVDLLAQHAEHYLTDESIPMQERIEELKAVCLTTAGYTREVFSFYFHFDPKRFNSSMDFLYVRDAVSQQFSPNDSENPSIYASRTKTTADWYYASADSRKACWLDPYVNDHVTGYEDLVVSSYTVPVFGKNQMLIGVIGMDFTLEGLTETLREIRLYETGYATLVGADGRLIEHPEYPFGTSMHDIDSDLAPAVEVLESGEQPEHLFVYHKDGIEKQLYFTTLRNGMQLLVTAPTREIAAAVRQMMGETIVLLAVVVISSVMIILCIVYSCIHPLRVLNRATTQIIEGNMNVEINYRGQDEIGTLAENFRKMTEFLQDHISHINALAYSDAMTGVKNKASYERAVASLQERMRQGFDQFGVIVFDLNNLKRTNDSEGHEAGDRLIKNASSLICKAFAHSPVYRIGGDEFVVLLENDDFRLRDQRFEELDRINRELNKTLPAGEQVSLAFGMACCKPKEDKEYSEVFQRADKAMYEHKVQMKQFRPEN